MKRDPAPLFVLGLLAIALSLLSCNKEEYDRDKGPSDIRIRNKSTQIFDSIRVNTSGGEQYYGSLNPEAESEYKRYDFAYPEADISLYIGQVKYTYGPVDYTYAVWLGKGKFTYELTIADPVNYILDIKVIADAPLD